MKFHAAIAGLMAVPALAQTESKCNPAKSGNCPADPALGGHASFDFKSKSNQWSLTGKPEPDYGSNGAQMSIKQKGDAPTLASDFYIMFGHVDFQFQAAPGRGIVSSAILISDDLDEVDFEVLGGNNNQVETNYFGKGITGDYNRAKWLPVSGTHDSSHTYSVDWTADRIEWQVDGKTIRTLTPSDAQGSGNPYPQSPMKIRIGIWAGGASSSQGTVEWAGGPTDFSQAPFNMQLKSIDVTDYSTGSSYSYKGTSGSWKSIQAKGGHINPSGKPGEGAKVSGSSSTSTSSSSGSSSGASASATSTSSSGSTSGGSGDSSSSTSSSSSAPSSWQVSHSHKSTASTPAATSSVSALPSSASPLYSSKPTVTSAPLTSSRVPYPIPGSVTHPGASGTAPRATGTGVTGTGVSGTPPTSTLRTTFSTGPPSPTGPAAAAPTHNAGARLSRSVSGVVAFAAMVFIGA